MPGSNGHGTTAQRLAQAAHERREAIFEAGAESVIPGPPRVPTMHGLGEPRDKLPTLDDLTSEDEARARPARWKLVVSAVGALAALAEVARQLVGLIKH